MTASVWISLIAAAISLVALFFTGLSAVSAWRQTKLQRQIHEDSRQPYVWCDIGASTKLAGLMEIVLGNAGPTVATDIQVEFDPPLPRGGQTLGREDAEARLRAGIKFLAPGRKHIWNIGIGHELLQDAEPQPHRVTLRSRGPFGALPERSYVIDLADFRETAQRPEGSLHLVQEELKGLGTALKKIADS